MNRILACSTRVTHIADMLKAAVMILLRRPPKNRMKKAMRHGRTQEMAMHTLTRSVVTISTYRRDLVMHK